MSFHVINTTLTFCWSLNATDETLVKADFDIIVHKPDGTSTYTNDGLTTFVAPTPTSNGEATFDILVDQLGRYQITLSIGASDDYLVKALREVYIVDPPAFVTGGTPAKITRGPEIIPYIPTPVNTSSWDDIERIDAIGYDGGNTVLISVWDSVNGALLMQTTPELTDPVQLVELDTLTNWYNFGIQNFRFIVYSPKLNLWVGAQNTGESYWSDDNGVTWNNITRDVNWSTSSSSAVTLFWDTGMELFYFGSGNGSTPLLYSADGKSWSQQRNDTALGGVHPERLYTAARYVIGGTSVHMMTQWEEYVHQTGDAGNQSNWSKTNNNGVMAGSGSLYTLSNTACDGQTIAVTGFGAMNMTTDPSNHPDGWGPDGNANVGYRGLDIGMSDNLGDIDLLLYCGQLDRPWVLFNSAHGWWDCAALATGGAPVFAEVDSGPFLPMQTQFLIDSNTHIPLPRIGGFNQSMSYGENNPDSPWGKDGWAVIIQGNQARTDDYILFQKSQ